MDKQIVKHNAAIKASYRLTIDEQRLMMLCITKVSRNNNANSRRFSIRHDEYCNEFSTSYAYRNMRDAAHRLQQRIIKITEKTTIDGVTYDGGAINVLSRQMWQENEGEIMLEFSEYFMPYLEALSRDFTRYGLKDVAGMKSIYSIRIFEFIKMHYNQHHKEPIPFIIEVSELKRMFELEDKYKLYANFRKKVIDVAVKEINKISPLTISYEQMKKGRRIHALKFSISPKAAIKKIKSGGLAEKKIQKTCDDIRKAFASGKSIKINGKKVKDISGNVVSFEDGAGNLFSLVKNKSDVVSEQIETLF